MNDWKVVNDAQYKQIRIIVNKKYFSFRFTLTEVKVWGGGGIVAGMRIATAG